VKGPLRNYHNQLLFLRRKDDDYHKGTTVTCQGQLPAVLPLLRLMVRLMVPTLVELSDSPISERQLEA
jgi:hypothetical protein